jgi:predicted ATPase
MSEVQNENRHLRRTVSQCSKYNSVTISTLAKITLRIFMTHCTKIVKKLAQMGILLTCIHRCQFNISTRTNTKLSEAFYGWFYLVPPCKFQDNLKLSQEHSLPHINKFLSITSHHTTLHSMSY